MEMIEILLGIISIIVCLVFIALTVGTEFVIVVLIIGSFLFLDGLRREWH